MANDFEMALETDTRNALELKQSGNELYKKGLYKEAMDLYSQAINMAPTIATYYGNRSAAALMLKQYAGCLSDCKKAIELDPAFMKAYSRGAACCVTMGNLEEAKTILEMSRENSGEGFSLQTQVNKVSNLLSKQERLNSAIQGERFSAGLSIARELLRDISDNLELRMLFCELLARTGNVQDAFSVINSIYKENPSNLNASWLKALGFYYNQNTALAIRVLQDALRKDPDNSKCLKLFKMIKKLDRSKTAANNAFKHGRLPEACELYTECLEIDPCNGVYNSTICCNRAMALLKMKEYQKAFDDCDKAIEMNPDYAKAYVRRATARQHLEQYEEAVQDCKKACELDEDDSAGSKRALRDAELELKKSKRKNWYKILSIEVDADEYVIKKAYRKKALKWHPDKWSNATEEEQESAEVQFKDINEAFTILSDPQKRHRFDSGADIEEHGGMGGVDPSEVFQMFFNGGGGMGGMGGGHSHGGHSHGGGGNPFGAGFRFG
eukprot:135622_1